MALPKQSVQLNFAQGLDLKSDPWQVDAGKFLSLKNTVFTKGGLLQKRNGFGLLPSLTSEYKSLTTYKSSLIGLGLNLSYYNADSQQWLTGNNLLNVQNTVVPMVRNSDAQTAVDIAIAPNGLACAVYLDSDGVSYYRILDSTTGELIIAQTSLGSTSNMARAFVLGNYFIITFLQTVAATPHLRYIAIPLNTPNAPIAVADISTQVKSITAGYDGIVANNTLYLGWYGSDGGGSVRINRLTSTLQLGTAKIIATQEADLFSVTADISGNLPIVWFTWYDSGTSNGYTTAYDSNLNVLLARTQVITSKVITKITSAANAQINNIFYEVSNTYSFSSVRSDFTNSVTCTLAGSVGSTVTILRSVGLAGKAFYFAPTATIYMLTAYNGSLQPTYFLIDSIGNVVSKLAYSNGGGYTANQIIASANVFGNNVYYGYQFKDLLLPINKTVQGVQATNGIYSTTGVNLAKFGINSSTTVTVETGNNLHLSGGFMWMFDGVKPVEHNFHLYPEDITAVWADTGGSVAAQPDGATNTNAYAYQVTYEWTDAAGNIHRSAPSIPVFVTTTGSGTTGSITLNIPTLRLTYKTTPNPVRIMIYRWSVANPVFYVAISPSTFITVPTINNPSVDSVVVVNIAPDTSIVGNPILYTNGGVVENIAAPATPVMTLFQSRLFLIDAEDRNLLWYSKQVIENTPVEMSDLFTIFVAPTTGAQGSTGDMRTLFPMDDKLIIGKDNALYYITGAGPDNTGSQNFFSEPVFITATVGCANQQSFVMIPQGLMFQSDKGVWLLGRDINTSYIGAPIESLTEGTLIQSAVAIPGTNQVRFTLDSGITLMYDYYFDKWSSFIGIPGISSTLFQGMHTFLNSHGEVYQETPDQYLDGSNPVLISFTTAWIKTTGLQGFQRAYYFYMLANFLSPHTLNIKLAYDYNPNPIQSSNIIPTNYGGTWGAEALWGDGESWGSSEGSVEQHRVFFEQQKCQSFQVIAQEFFDASYGTTPGAGLTISGLNLVIGSKKGYPVLRGSKSVG